MITLNKKLEVIIPKEDNAGYEIDFTLLNKYINSITSLVGGVTITEGRGGWYSKEEKRMMYDDIATYEWYHNGNDFIELSHYVSYLVEDLCALHGQEAVSVKVDNVLYIIEKTDNKRETIDMLENLLIGN